MLLIVRRRGPQNPVLLVSISSKELISGSRYSLIPTQRHGSKFWYRIDESDKHKAHSESSIEMYRLRRLPSNDPSGRQFLFSPH